MGREASAQKTISRSVSALTERAQSDCGAHSPDVLSFELVAHRSPPSGEQHLIRRSPGRPWDLARVHPRGWGEVGSAVGSDVDLPAVMVDHAVMVSAEEHQVLQAGRAVVGPVADVMCVAPAR